MPDLPKRALNNSKGHFFHTSDVCRFFQRSESHWAASVSLPFSHPARAIVLIEPAEIPLMTSY